MKTKHIVLAVLMIFAVTTLSQSQTFYPVLKNYSAADKARLDKVYAFSLSRANDGLVESALAIVTMIKLDAPADEFPMIKDRINYLANHSTSPMIRYKACLAGAVFANPAQYKTEGISQYSDSDAFFNTLAENTNKALLSSY